MGSAVGLTHNRDVLARTTADNDGRFAFDGIAIPPRLEESITSLMRGQGGVELVAWADGRAPTIRSTGLSTRTWTFASSRRWH